ncbi:helix-turn-helix domain-containing protein [Seleniivibrio woodruffii]|uniref:helix-turn-helix domain-containing protein n=1 Tax=Seleniivibrio woodruffii TaxID=1078050 RepID=UPI003C70345E
MSQIYSQICEQIKPQIISELRDEINALTHSNKLNVAKPEKKRLDTKQAAKILGREPQTLAKWRSNGIGPEHHTIGRNVYYYMEDLLAYIKPRKP